MRVQLVLRDHTAGQEGVCARRQIQQSVFTARNGRIPVKLINVAPALEPKPLEQGKRRFLRQHGQIEFARLLDDVVRVVRPEHRNGDALHLLRELHGGIDDAGIVAFAAPCREREQAVAQLMQRAAVHTVRTGGPLRGKQFRRDRLRQLVDPLPSLIRQARKDPNARRKDRHILHASERFFHETSRDRRP